MSTINVTSRANHIVVDPASKAVAIIGTGPVGPTGPTGPTGDVSQAQLDAAIAGLPRDTGWRNILADIENGWTANTLKVRRFDSIVWIQARGLSASGATGTRFVTLPTGFQIDQGGIITVSEGTGTAMVPRPLFISPAGAL